MLRLTRYNVSIVIFICLGSYAYGFSFAVFNTSIGQPGFYDYFDLDSESQEAAHIIGAISALFCAGAAFGAIIQGWSSDRLGRRNALALGGAIALLGTILVACSVNLPMLFVFRFITGLGLGQLLALVPLYISEIAPPHRRGLLTSLTGCGFSLGYLSSAWIGYGCYFATNLTVQWRMPLCLCPISPLILVIGCYWLPESPRWLIWNGEMAKAWDIIKKIHHDPTDEQDSAAHAEYTQIDRQVAHDKQTPATYYNMFTVPSWRKRTLLAILVIFGAQSSGINGVTNYVALESKNVGLTGSKPLLVYAVYVLVAISSNLLSVTYIDKLGRRKMLHGRRLTERAASPVVGLFWTCLCLVAIALLEWKYSSTPNKGGNAAAILFINLFGVGCGLFIDNTQFVFCGEVFPTTIRSRGLTISIVTYFLSIMVYTTPGPTAFTNIGWKYYLVWIACDVITFTLIYLYLPETTGLTLEEMGALFGDTVMTQFTANGSGLVELNNLDEYKANESVVEHVEDENA